jgi:uncharacterized protein involved in tolerance to divalent cations
MEDHKPVYINIPCPTVEEATSLATHLLSHDLAGTAKISPNTTLMYHDGTTKSEAVAILNLKSTTSHLTDIQTYIYQNHSWGTPCIEVLPILTDMC